MLVFRRTLARTLICATMASGVTDIVLNVGGLMTVIEDQSPSSYQTHIRFSWHNLAPCASLNRLSLKLSDTSVRCKTRIVDVALSRNP